MRQNCFKFHKNFFKNYLQINFFVLILHLQHCWGEKKIEKVYKKIMKFVLNKNFFLYICFLYICFFRIDSFCYLKLREIIGIVIAYCGLIIGNKSMFNVYKKVIV